MYEVKGKRYEVRGKRCEVRGRRFEEGLVRGQLYTFYFILSTVFPCGKGTPFPFSIFNSQFSVYRNASTFPVVTSATCSMGHSKMSATFWAMMGT